MGFAECRRAIAISWLAFAAAFAGCGRAEPSRNVVLVVIDTLRADHLGLYGYSRGTSPHLDAFAASATVYQRAIASSPWTLPSHASLFTGLPSFLHGAHAFFVSTPWLRNAHPLSQSHFTLAEAMAGQGFATAAFVANHGFLDESMHINQGFDVYHVKHEPAARQNARILGWLDSLRGQPFFLFVNYMDSHRYYNTEPIPSLLETPASRDKKLLDRLEEAVLPATDPVPEELAQAVIDQYDTGIAHVDRAVGSLLAKLRALELYDETLVIVTSDHGEYFGEHHLVEHFLDVYQEALWIPLIVKRAHQTTSERNETQISSMHIPNLIAREMVPDVSAALLERFPKSPESGDPVIAEGYFSFSDVLNNRQWAPRFSRVRRAVFDWPFKLIHSSDGAHELYDLESDPHEQTNLVRSRPGVAKRLAAQLVVRLEAAGVDPSPRFPFERRRRAQERISDEQAEALRSLGYAD